MAPARTGLRGLLRSTRRALVVPVALIGLIALPIRPAFAADFNDVPPSYWDYTAITYVAKTNPWMLDYGAGTFLPNANEQRKYLARTLVTVFASGEPVDSKIHFPDLPDSDPFYPYANVATKLGWIPKWKSGVWAPNSPMMMSGFDTALIKGLGYGNPNYQEAVGGLLKIGEADGTPYVVDPLFPYLQIGRTLLLHYNHSDETQDLLWTTYVQRDEAAYSLWKAKTLQSWQILKLDMFDHIALGTLSDGQADKHNLIQYMLTQVGHFPYIYAGEWDTMTVTPPYCCGSQPKGGLDCSGWVWWTMKKNESNYDAAQFHPAYTGWSLADRSSSGMAQHAPTPITFGNLQTGDLMFFASNGGNDWSDVDHVGVFVGNGWMIHTASTQDGPAIEWIKDGYYFDNFVFGRRIIGVQGPQAPSHEDYKTAGDRT